MNIFKYNNDILYKKIQWCLGCGNYSILYQLGKFLEKIKLKKNKIVLISGIGCSSRFPYFMNTLGIHTIHGRSFPIAFGLKLSNPKLNIWIITGDGDAYLIGINHLLHIVKKNININILIINNGVLALTKGKEINYNNFNPLSLLLSSGCSFLARCLYNDFKHIQKILKAAYKHQGTSFIEIYQYCPIYNKKNKNQSYIILKHNKPLFFFIKNKKYAIIINKLKLLPIIKKYNILLKKKIWIHNQNNLTLSYILCNFNYLYKNLPIPLGIIYKKKTHKYINLSKRKGKINNLLKKNYLF
ncbi:MAG: thiamine pyrophosphate-dependent enzyme [Candidatus Shikimatogenerans bostrichidophilus]|nr:MAG: thiamine pyrophosphate-dependent enzyme [Candidatus Shikimatogenerans bostrichidophilus]